MAETQSTNPAPGADPAALGADTMQDLAAFSENLTRAWTMGQEAWSRMLSAQAKGGMTPPSPSQMDPFNIMPAWVEFTKGMMSRPDKAAQTAINFWVDYAQLWRQSWMRALGAKPEAVAPGAGSDKRFSDPAWTENALFDHIKQSYLLASSHIQSAVADADGLPASDRAKLDFFTKRYIEAMSPTNFFATNPEALRETMSQKGENLVRGMTNMLKDIERGGGTLQIAQTDMNAFKYGENIASTPGKVVFRNDLIELIQYAPITEKVYAKPLVIVPPWINKFYIMDLDAKKSMVRWLVSRGYTVFMVSWKNPEPGGVRHTMEDYIQKGFSAAIDAALKETGRKSLNVVGYCIGGTMVSTALAWMAQNGDDRVSSATFFTAQVDFEKAGDLKVMVDDKILAMLQEKTDAAGGVLDAKYMAQSFNMMRSSDLVWSYVISNYMLGKEPFPFDMLYWNSDSTRMPAKLHICYLRDYYMDNALSRGELEIFGKRLNLGDIRVPVYSVAAREDHIAPAASVYRGVKLYGGPTRFVVGGSGHIAGIINPPDKKKYQYWTYEGAGWPADLPDWLAVAQETPGSWWPDWDAWLAQQSGDMVAARQPGKKLGVLDEAPGTYVREKS